MEGPVDTKLHMSLSSRNRPIYICQMGETMCQMCEVHQMPNEQLGAGALQMSDNMSDTLACAILIPTPFSVLCSHPHGDMRTCAAACCSQHEGPTASPYRHWVLGHGGKVHGVGDKAHGPGNSEGTAHYIAAPTALIHASGYTDVYDRSLGATGQAATHSHDGPHCLRDLGMHAGPSVGHTGPSGGHQGAVRGPSGGHQGPIRGPSGGHRTVTEVM